MAFVIFSIKLRFLSGLSGSFVPKHMKSNNHNDQAHQGDTQACVDIRFGKACGDIAGKGRNRTHPGIG
nr:MAG TPA: hypothetical protein [Caudoviricetes sp.]